MCLGVFVICHVGGMSGVGKGPCKFGWKVAMQGTFPEKPDNQYPGSHVGGRGGDLEVRNRHKKEGG